MKVLPVNRLHRSVLVSAIALVAALSAAAEEAAPVRTLDGLPPAVRYWTESAYPYMDAQWDEAAGLVGDGARHGTRASAQYAVALLLRNGPGDGDRVRRIVEALARVQVDAPQSADHGTWPPVAEERSTLPGLDARPSLDPNWREFIGSEAILMLEAFGPRLDGSTTALLEQCLRRAAAGAHARSVRAQYTNIAIMSAHLMGYAGTRFGVDEWREHGARLADTLYRNFRENGSFDEYNSPTYGGVDLYGLGLWRHFPVTPGMADRAREMEEGFWRDIAAFYHAGLRNLCGPYDRAYGMDMREYVALAGVWIAFESPRECAPVPDPDTNAAKDGERFFIPSFALVRSEPPAEAVAALRAFAGERLVRRPIGNGARVATAWLSKDLMIGGGVTPPFKDSPEQAHAATAHWTGPDGGVCWLRARGDFSMEATAGRNTLTLRCTKYFRRQMGDSVCFEVHAPGARAEEVEAGRWRLPGLEVRVDTGLAAPTVRATAEGLEICYPLEKGAPEAQVGLTLAADAAGKK